MKNKSIRKIYLGLAIFFIVYFILQEINSPFILGFSGVWLFVGLFFIFAARLVSKRGSEKKYVFMENFPKKLKVAVIFLIFFGIAVSSVSLYFIFSPIINDGSIETKYVIVLGGGVNIDGTLGGNAQLRVEKAASYLKNHPDSKAVVTEGKLPLYPYVGAEVMAKELMKLGIEEKRIIRENKAKDTVENFKFSIEKIALHENISKEEVLETPITVVTTSSHLARSERLARMFGFKTVYGIATPVEKISFLSTYCREICSYIKLELRRFFILKN